MTYIEHLMSCLGEEAAEVTQAASKANRFAINGTYPDGTGNVEMIVRELNDLYAVVEMLQELGVAFDGLGDRDAIEAKKSRVQQHMCLAIERGALHE